MTKYNVTLLGAVQVKKTMVVEAPSAKAAGEIAVMKSMDGGVLGWTMESDVYDIHTPQSEELPVDAPGAHVETDEDGADVSDDNEGEGEDEDQEPNDGSDEAYDNMRADQDDPSRLPPEDFSDDVDPAGSSEPEPAAPTEGNDTSA